MLKRFMAGAALALLTSAATAQIVTDDSAKRIPADTLKTMMRAVSDELRDPSSAQFRRLFMPVDWRICGEVNGKNALGAYAGYIPFMYSVESKYIFIANPNDPALTLVQITLKNSGCTATEGGPLIVPTD